MPEWYKSASEVEQERRERAEEEVRRKRDNLLRETDYTQLPDAPAESQKWTGYRQKLRNITKQKGFPFDIKWPEEPGA